MILFDLKQSAAECSIDESTLLRWVQSGTMPAPILVDGLPRWAPAVLERWAADGCPQSEPLHHSTMHAIRKGWLEDFSRRTDQKIRILEDIMENDES